VLDLLLPQRCAACRAPGPQLCDACLETLPRIEAPLCDRCGAPTAWPVRRCRECAGRRLAFARARAAVAYDERVRALVGAWKEHGLRRLALPAADLVATAIDCPRTEVIAFVPADVDRGLRRGHHPAEALARELAVRWRLPLASLLGRSRAVRPQRGLTLAERRRNVAGAFTASECPRRVALVDDVYTTGATANAAASALRAAGSRHVEIVTFARAVR
jgi:predicted amidophosphoribosyltransferase